jgi:hypothetical protein
MSYLENFGEAGPIVIENPGAATSYKDFAEKPVTNFGKNQFLCFLLFSKNLFWRPHVVR